MSPPFDILGDGIITVFDLEYTTWEGAMERNWSGPGEYCEIVQIGAVKLDGSRDLAETASFQSLVKPMINPVLSDYFVELTGITQERVDADGVAFPDAMASLDDFIGDDTSAVYSFGGDEKHLYLNCGLHGMSCPIDMRLFRDIMPMFQNSLGWGNKPLAVAELPGLLGFDALGRNHDALDDARCIAAALRNLSQPVQ